MQIYIDRVIICSDADPEVIAKVKGNLGDSVDYLEVETPDDAFSSSKEIHKLSKATLVLRARRSPFTKRFDAVPKGSICTRFHQLTPELNCVSECHYCYLEKTLRYPHLMLPTHFTNYDRMFKDIERTLEKNKGRNGVIASPVIFNLGELADSRMLDHITEFSRVIVPFIARTENGYLHCLSKSRNYENFLDLEHRDEDGRTRVIQVASVNAQPVIDAVEHKTGSLIERVTAISKFQEAGYRVRYRFDPLMFVGDLFETGMSVCEDLEATKKMYSEMMDVVFEYSNPEMITMGTYRPSSGLNVYLDKRYPNSPILQIETSLDRGKGRVEDEKRFALYSWFSQEIKRRSPGTAVAVCKETPSAWNTIGKSPTPLECSCLLFADERKKEHGLKVLQSDSFSPEEEILQIAAV